MLRSPIRSFSTAWRAAGDSELASTLSLANLKFADVDVDVDVDGDDSIDVDAADAADQDEDKPSGFLNNNVERAFPPRFASSSFPLSLLPLDDWASVTEGSAASAYAEGMLPCGFRFHSSIFTSLLISFISFSVVNDTSL